MTITTIGKNAVRGKMVSRCSCISFFCCQERQQLANFINFVIALDKPTRKKLKENLKIRKQAWNCKSEHLFHVGKKYNIKTKQKRRARRSLYLYRSISEVSHYIYLERCALENFWHEFLKCTSCKKSKKRP